MCIVIEEGRWPIVLTSHDLSWPSSTGREIPPISHEQWVKDFYLLHEKHNLEAAERKAALSAIPVQA